MVKQDLEQHLEQRCLEQGVKLTEQRRIIARVLTQSQDHPDVEELYKRAVKLDPKISIATVYRTVRLLSEIGVIDKHEFRDGRARYEITEEHHDHLINIKTGEVVEFSSDEIRELQELIAKKLGYKLVDHRLELYGLPLDNQDYHQAINSNNQPVKVKI
jgi:Fur family ferric uptake transcriptional regulator